MFKQAWLKLKNIIYVYISWAFMLFSAAFIIVNNISEYFIHILAVSVLFSLIQIVCFKTSYAVHSRTSLTDRAKYNVPVVIFFIITLVLYMPGELYLNNISEFQIAPSDFGVAMAINAAIYSAIFLFGSLVLGGYTQNKLFTRALFAITFCGYLQNMFLNGHMTQMDGGRQTWHAWQILINSAVWLVLIVIILCSEKLFVGIDIDKLCRTICIYVSLIEVAALGIMAVTSSKVLAHSQSQYQSGYPRLTYEGLFELSPQNNVIVFVLDWFDEQLLEQILEEDKDFLSPLEGFTCYTNTTSQYAFTEMALPYLLTDVEWQYGMSESEYCEFAFENGTILKDISESGFDIGIYTDTIYIRTGLLGIKNLKNVNMTVSANKWMQVMMQCAKYKAAPLVVKHIYWWESNAFQNLFKENESGYTADDDKRIFGYLMQSGLRTNGNNQNIFRFIHMRGAHPPFREIAGCTDADDMTMLSQARGSMKVVFEYMEQMKKLGIYDKATIIITADHGENYLYGSDNRLEKLSELGMEKTSSPILLVKNKENEDTGVQYSNAPVSHKEVIGEMMRAVNPALCSYGNTLDEIGEDDERDRFFVFKRSDLPFVKVLIRGDVRDISNWNVIEEIPAGKQ